MNDLLQDSVFGAVVVILALLIFWRMAKVLISDDLD